MGSKAKYEMKLISKGQILTLSTSDAVYKRTRFFFKIFGKNQTSIFFKFCWEKIDHVIVNMLRARNRNEMKNENCWFSSLQRFNSVSAIYIIKKVIATESARSVHSVFIFFSFIIFSLLFLIYFLIKCMAFIFLVYH